MVNEYGYVSGGAIFTFLDKKAHNSAKKIIGDCVTSGANIDFFKPILEIKDYKEDVVHVKEKIVKVITYLNKNSIIASFTFIKKK